jgi:uncharacterized lipoprotein YddW (UPF0748 family)
LATIACRHKREAANCATIQDMTKPLRNATAAVSVFLALAIVAMVVVAQGSGRQWLPVVARGPISTNRPVAKINFQPAASAVPDGYTPDTGAVFGSRPGGQAFGWNADTSATTRERESAFAPDQRYDTFIHLQKPENPNAVWEYALPNGVYEIYLVAGDPDFTDGVYSMTVEGIPALNGTPTASTRFVQGQVIVQVSDGRLSVGNGAGAVNNKLAFLEIYSLSDPTPTPTATVPPGDAEFRGLWVTRFDWTTFNQPASPARIDTIVNNAAAAGFNVIFFQVRGTADAYYTPGLEPWAQRVSGGSFGQPPSPAWDPLAYFIQKAHAAGLQLHAYVNVYPVSDRVGSACPPPPLVSPTPLYFLLQSAHGVTDGKLNAAQWTTADQPSCGDYLMGTPASPVLQQHIKAVVTDLIDRYAVDGIHLDRVRYAGRTTSCDPVSEAAYGAPCFVFNGQTPYSDWQREQINTLVRDVYEDIILPAGRDIWLTAAVWHTYVDKWGWGYSQGYSDYYQDSQGWVKGGYIDAISPMMYSSNPETFRLERWTTLTADFQANRGDRYIVPGIGADQPFKEIADRIEAARQLGTAGHAIFSYGALEANGYFDDLASGPYAEPAAVPGIPWHN